MKFEETVKNSPAILTEGAVIERLHRDIALELDPFIAHAGLIYDETGKKILETIYRQYMDTGLAYKLPIIVSAPTWRANPERIKRSIFQEHRTINKDCVNFIAEIRKDYTSNSENIYIGGLMACRGDAYRAEEALSEADAKRFHTPQANALADAAVDFIMAATLPAVSEALGMAAAIADFGVPYCLSFVIKRNGAVLDGSPLHKAIEKIDSAIDPKPFFYMVNCVHPEVFRQGIGQEFKKSEFIKNRLIGFQANTSSKSPEELDGLDYLDTTDPAEFAESMVSLHNQFGIQILGGCCGTDNRHIEEIAKHISNCYAGKGE
ncbi:MAG: homocysteine S-methyltransferase family protein [Desulfobacterales bacterium]|nr:MAG: homocysteine S-methyltransferase family protein [Desulfobacterales bacterium]